MLDQELLESAFTSALEDPDLRDALAGLSQDEAEAREELFRAVSGAAAEIESAASQELEALANASEELANAQRAAIEAAAARSPDTGEALGLLRGQLAGLELAIDRW